MHGLACPAHSTAGGSTKDQIKRLVLLGGWGDGEHAGDGEGFVDVVLGRPDLGLGCSRDELGRFAEAEKGVDTAVLEGGGESEDQGREKEGCQRALKCRL